jgi:predicted signal transduction protein with EAL and GGDEF domain
MPDTCEQAVEMLKKKAELQKTYSGERQSQNLLRQEDDDDNEIPYYVPAIAKVVGSVLARNVTSIIEESFGFIPPDVNLNIRHVIGLIADTVRTKLKRAIYYS